MDVLAPTTMKDAAKCATQCELQNSVNHQIAERKLRSRDIPESMYISVFPLPHTLSVLAYWVGD